MDIWANNEHNGVDITMSKLTEREQLLTVCVLGLFSLLALNYLGDFTYRGTVNEHIDYSNANFQTIVEVNNLHADVHKELDKDVESNYKVIDQLIGIILRDDI